MSLLSLLINLICPCWIKIIHFLKSYCSQTLKQYKDDCWFNLLHTNRAQTHRWTIWKVHRNTTSDFASLLHSCQKPLKIKLILCAKIHVIIHVTFLRANDRVQCWARVGTAEQHQHRRVLFNYLTPARACAMTQGVRNRDPFGESKSKPSNICSQIQDP